MYVRGHGKRDLYGWNVKIKFLWLTFSHSSHIGPFSHAPSHYVYFAQYLREAVFSLRVAVLSQVKLLKSLGLKSTLITDGSSPINLFNTAHGLIGALEAPPPANPSTS